MTSWFLQYTEQLPSETEARRVFAWLQTQMGYCGGRVLPPSAAKPGWRVQVFFEDETFDWFPDGVRRVYVPDGVRRTVGITR